MPSRMIISSRKAQLGLMLTGLALVVLYIVLWVATGEDEVPKLMTLALFVFSVLMCWAYMIRDKWRDARILKRGKSK